MTSPGATSPTPPTCAAGHLDPDDGERNRVTVTLATGIPEDVVRSVNLNYLDPAPVDIAAYEADPDTFVEPHAGEVLYRLRTRRPPPDPASRTDAVPTWPEWKDDHRQDGGGRDGGGRIGKSTIADLLAHQLGWTTTEADDLHSPANVAKMAAGIPLNDTDREPWLRRICRRIERPTVTRSWPVQPSDADTVKFFA